MGMTTGVGGNQMSETDEVSACTDLFQNRVREVGMLSGKTFMLSNTQVDADSLVTFQIAPTNNQYVQMNRSRLWITFKVVREDGTDMQDTDDVSVVNLIGSSLFESIEFDWDGTGVPQLGNVHVQYKAMFETLLSYGRSASDSHLQASRYIMDEPGFYDAVENPRFRAADGAGNIGRNDGYNIRGAWLRGSRVIDVECAVPADFMQSDRLLPPGSKLTMKLTRGMDSFCLLSSMANQRFKIKIMKIKLMVRVITLTPTLAAHHRTLAITQKKPVLHNYKRTIIRTRPIPQGRLDMDLNRVFDGILPKSVIFALANSQAVSGAVGKNPFHFPHANLSEIALYVNNEQFPAEQYRPNFADELIVREYNALFRNTGIHHSDSGTTLSMSHWLGGSTMYAWDLTPDQCNGYHSHFSITGDMSIKMAFRVGTTEELTAIIIGIFDVVFKNSITQQTPVVITS
jgi:hypothetical protein